MTVFCAKLYGSRSHKNKTCIQIKNIYNTSHGKSRNP